LQEFGYNNLLAFDPLANEAFDREYNFQQILYCGSLEDIYEKSDVLVLVTAWKEFADINKKSSAKTIVDCRYFL
jgi:UDPglucose 6-dehydrogenase